MEKVINSAVTYYALFSIGIFVIATMIYCTIGVDEDSFWWVFDKVNDRFLTFNLLFVTSFIFRDIQYKLFIYNAMLYIMLYCGYEVTFILKLFNVTPKMFVSISFVYWAISSLIYLLLYVTKRESK